MATGQPGADQPRGVFDAEGRTLCGQTPDALNADPGGLGTRGTP